MLIFVFHSIFKLQFDQKKGPILLMAAVISAGTLEEVSKSFFVTIYWFKIQEKYNVHKP